MPRKRLFILGFIIILAVILAWQISKPGTQNPPIPTPDIPAIEGPWVEIGSKAIPVEIAETAEEVQRGLSGRPSLHPDEGMLFIFWEPAKYQFWMPDMHFPIDIIWINENKIIDISADVSNEFDPKNPKFYSPKVPVNYVLEVNAGFAKKHGIKVGDLITLNGLE